jgi:quinol monooxygenase YgiN
MYGTIAKLKAKKGSIEQLRKMEMARRPAGYVATYVFQSDTSQDELWLVAIFKDKATYVANAESPEQDREFKNLMQFLTAEPEWHDGEVVFSSPG